MIKRVPDLLHDPKAVRVMKKPISVSVFFAEKDGVCSTLEGDVGYSAGAAILRGVQGEEWPIEKVVFEKTYSPVPPTLNGESGIYVKKPIAVLAKRLTSETEITLSSGNSIVGNEGDWLIQYAPDDYGIVSENIFEESYQIL